MKREVLFFLDARDQIWLDIVDFIAKENPTYQITVVDMAAFTYPKVPPWRVPRLYEGFSDPVSAMFASYGVKYIQGGSVVGQSIPEAKGDRERLKTAIVSNYVSAARTVPSNLHGIKWMSVSVLQHHLSRLARRAFGVSEQIMSLLEPARVYVINGRLPQQKAAVIAAEHLNLEIWFLELDRGRLYRSRYQPHDRIRSQEELSKVAQSLSGSQMTTSISSWLAQFSSANAEMNKFSVTRTDTGANLADSGHLAIFATSSRDEYESVEFDFSEAQWESQLHAFSEVWRIVGSTDLKPILKIHPNLLNKRPFFVVGELSRIRRFLSKNPNFTVVGPSDKQNIYAIFPRAALVVVHNSTVGLEASIRGIPVICTNSTSYDSLADVTKFHSLEQVKLLAKVQSYADPTGAMKFLAARDALSVPIKFFPGRIVLENYSLRLQIIRSIRDASIFSIMFEQRWHLYRELNRRIEKLFLANARRMED